LGTICVKVSNFFGGYTLKLPLKDSELARELEKARCGPDNTIYIAQVEYPEGLRMLNGSSVDADELNFLAKSIDRYVQSEYDQFMAAASITKNVDVEKLINLSFNTSHFTLVKDVSNLSKLGSDHYMTIHGSMTIEEKDTLDFADIGRKLLSSGKGVPTEYGLLFENEEVPIETLYNGVNFPAYYYDPDFIAGVRLDYNGASEYLYLPEEDITIKKALKRLGCQDCNDCTVTVDTYGDIDEIWQDRMDESLEYEGLYEANHRAEILNKPGLDQDKLLKVFEYSEEVDTGTLQKLADHLDDFIVIPGAETAADVAEYFMQHEDGYRVDEYARDFLDFQKMGEYLIAERDGQFLGRAFVCMEENRSFERVMGRESQSMEFGGM